MIAVAPQGTVIVTSPGGNAAGNNRFHRPKSLVNIPGAHPSE